MPTAIDFSQLHEVTAGPNWSYDFFVGRMERAFESLEIVWATPPRPVVDVDVLQKPGQITVSFKADGQEGLIWLMIMLDDRRMAVDEVTYRTLKACLQSGLWTNGVRTFQLTIDPDLKFIDDFNDTIVPYLESLRAG